MDKISVLVSSCDKYEDAWNPFFFFFDKYWHNCPYPVYLNTETRQYSCAYMDVETINTPEPCSWSKRLSEALKQIRTEYVIFMLEDFFLQDVVNQKEINRCLDIMETDKTISVIDWEYVERIKTNPSPYTGYGYRDISSMYFLNCQTSIWRRKDLIMYLNPYESPWQFEIYGSERAKLYGKKFLLQDEPELSVFKYYFDLKYGYGISAGKWLKSNVELFSNNSINVDFSRLGFYENQEMNVPCPPPKKCCKDRLIYFLFGGNDEYIRMSLKDQLLYLLHHPRSYLHMLKNKFLFAFTDSRAI